MGKWSPHWLTLSHLPLRPPLYPSLPGISLEHSWLENIWLPRTFNFWSLCFHLILCPLSPKDLSRLPLYNQPLKDTTILWGRAALHQARHGDLTSLWHISQSLSQRLSHKPQSTGCHGSPQAKSLPRFERMGKIQRTPGKDSGRRKSYHQLSFRFNHCKWFLTLLDETMAKMQSEGLCIFQTISVYCNVAINNAINTLLKYEKSRSHANLDRTLETTGLDWTVSDKAAHMATLLNTNYLYCLFLPQKI